MPIRSSLSLVCLLMAAACATPIDPPPEFVVLKDAGEGHRLITADDARLRVREIAEESEGGAAFWAKTLRADLEQRGHRFVAEGDATDADQVPGRWLEFEVDADGERAHFLIALWPRTRGLLVKRHSLQVVEFLARDAVYAQRIEAVRKALGTVRW